MNRLQKPNHRKRQNIKPQTSTLTVVKIYYTISHELGGSVID